MFHIKLHPSFPLYFFRKESNEFGFQMLFAAKRGEIRSFFNSIPLKICKYWACWTKQILKAHQNKNTHAIYFFFLGLVPSCEETSFMTTFYGLYFNQHYTHIFHRLQFLLWASEGSFHVLHQLLCPFWHVVGTPSCCTTCVVLCCSVAHMSDVWQSFRCSLPVGDLLY